MSSMTGKGLPSREEVIAAWVKGRYEATCGLPCHPPSLDEVLAAEYRKGYKFAAAEGEKIWGRQMQMQESEERL